MWFPLYISICDVLILTDDTNSPSWTIVDISTSTMNSGVPENRNEQVGLSAFTWIDTDSSGIIVYNILVIHSMNTQNITNIIFQCDVGGGVYFFRGTCSGVHTHTHTHTHIEREIYIIEHNRVCALSQRWFILVFAILKETYSLLKVRESDYLRTCVNYMECTY